MRGLIQWILAGLCLERDQMYEADTITALERDVTNALGSIRAQFRKHLLDELLILGGLLRLTLY